MQLLFVVLTLYLLARFLVPRVAAWKSRSEAERSFAVRFTIFCGVLGFLFFLALVFLPNKGRVLAALPIFVIVLSLAKWWQASRLRLRHAAVEEANFQKARRVN